MNLTITKKAGTAGIHLQLGTREKEIGFDHQMTQVIVNMVEAQTGGFLPIDFHFAPNGTPNTDALDRIMENDANKASLVARLQKQIALYRGIVDDKDRIAAGIDDQWVRREFLSNTVAELLDRVAFYERWIENYG